VRPDGPWQSSETAQEVADKLKPMPLPIVLARASSYRKDGIHLKKLKKKPRRGLNVVVKPLRWSRHVKST
jgi:hypothetical protein